MVRDQYRTTNSADALTDKLCQSGLVSRLIISSAIDRGWIDRICGLGANEKLKLVNVLFSHLDSAKARSQVSHCSGFGVTVVECGFDVLGDKSKSIISGRKSVFPSHELGVNLAE
jgi:hypothetical protein